MSVHDNKNIAISEAFSETDKKTGEVVTLVPNTNNTVQP
ncbi:replication protein RepA, partial [Providencia rettgeri]